MILVTGASGTAGKALVEALRKAGRTDVLAALRKGGGVGSRRFDFADPSGWSEALHGVEAIFLMLPPGFPSAAKRFRVLLAECRRAGVRRAVFLSIRNADRLAFLPHRGIEKEIEASGIGWTHLRPNDWMQNFATQPLYRGDIAGGGLWLPNGRSRTSYVDVRDVAEVAALALAGGHEGRALSLTGPEELGTAEVAAIFTEVLGRPVTDHRPSLPGFIRHALGRGTPAPLAAVMTSIGLVARLGLARGVDPGVAQLLGRAPTTSGDDRQRTGRARSAPAASHG
jgi:uncharacterized protein YbjT (DUF2867 family)